jgi:predicted permease
MLAETNLSMGGYRDEQVPAMQKRMIDAVAAIPGVDAAGLISRTPLYGGGFISAIFSDQTTDLRPSSAFMRSERFHMSPDYFRAAGTVLLARRDVSWHDDTNAPGVAVVNREFARRMFGSPASAVGARFKLGTGRRIQIVGVVETGKYTSLTEDPSPAMFLPISQDSMSETSLVVRSRRDPQQLAGAIRTTVRGLDSGLPVFIETWDQQLELALFPSRIATVALGVLGGMGAILAVTGIFGMAAYSVSRRLKELGIRMALGAQRQEVLQAALGRAFKLLAFGSGAGLILGLLATRVLASIVYQATPRDPLVLGGVVLAMSLFGLLATWLPARRALSLDPLTLLREE